MSFATVYLRVLFLLMALAPGMACHPPKEDDPDIIVTFPPEFTVDLFEQRDTVTGAPSFGLWVESMASYDCSNYQIRGTTTVMGDAVDIQLQEIGKPDTCIGPPGPARSFLLIGPLAGGVYRFTLSLGTAIVNEGSLTVHNGHYELSLPNAQGIDFQNRVLESLPDHYTWGYALAPAEQDLPVADQFIANIKSLTIEPQLPPGFYSYFTVTGTGQYFFHRSIAPGLQNRPFLRRMTGTPDELRGLLQTFRYDPVRPLVVQCFSTFGAL